MVATLHVTPCSGLVGKILKVRGGGGGGGGGGRVRGCCKLPLIPIEVWSRDSDALLVASISRPISFGISFVHVTNDFSWVI